MLRVLLFAALLAPALLAQAPLFFVRGNLQPGAPQAHVEAALGALFAGPGPALLRSGVRTALPAGLRLLACRRSGSELRILLSESDARRLATAPLAEDAIEQIVKTALQGDARLSSAGVYWRDASGREHPLADLMRGALTVAPLSSTGVAQNLGTAQQVQGALSGKTIVVSPGHGYYWHSTLGWTTQRGSIGGLIEDVHNGEIARRFVVPYLENLGARVILCRDPGENPREQIVDNDGGAPAYSETGSWNTSASSGYGGGTYRFSTSSALSAGQASWTFNVPTEGHYVVSVSYRASSNRCRAARYHVHHAGGVETVEVDQTRDNLNWRRLGEWWFEAGTARLVLDTASSDVGRALIADAARLGSGLGVISRGSGTSGRGKWLEASRYWAEFNGAPSSVWNSSTADNNDDVTCRPRFAEYLGADAFVSMHTNAGGGAGTSSFIHNTSATAGSAALQAAIHTQLISDLRSQWDSSWVDRGRKTANFGELRLLSSMPGTLLELAFHDTDGSKDHDAIHDPKWRRIAGRAIARGVLRYFQPSAALAPLAPELVAVRQDGLGGLRVEWNAVSGATSYGVEISRDGKSFVEAGQTPATSWSTGPLAHGSVRSFRVRAWNTSGRSWPSEVLTAGTSHTGEAELLLVAGFDRLGEFVKSPENTHDYLRQHGDAIRRHGRFSLGFDACTNESVSQLRVSLPQYRAVIWQLGEESTQDETFSSLEQLFVRSYLQAGGRLMVSGAELAWDLEARGSAADTAFLQGVLGTRYVRDDAQTYSARDVAGEIFAGIGFFGFDDGSRGTYDVDWPDVLAPSDAKSRVVLRYGVGNDAAAIARIDGSARVLVLGFPLETMYPIEKRSELMARALRFLLEPRALEMPNEVAIPSSHTLAISLPQSANDVYVLAASLTNQPGLPLAPGRVLPLMPDPLFGLSLGQSNGVFGGFAGLLDGQGRAQAGLTIPAMASLSGLQFYVSGLSLSAANAQVGAVLPWYTVRL
jgi:N-acetylmuramoyl-L-alanine amidase